MPFHEGEPEGLSKIVEAAIEKYGDLYCLASDGAIKSMNYFCAAAIFKEAHGLIYNEADRPREASLRSA